MVFIVPELISVDIRELADKVVITLLVTVSLVISAFANDAVPVTCKLVKVSVSGILILLVLIFVTIKF